MLVERAEWEGKLADLQRTVEKVNEEKDYQQEVVKLHFQCPILFILFHDLWLYNGVNFIVYKLKIAVSQSFFTM